MYFSKLRLLLVGYVRPAVWPHICKNAERDPAEKTDTMFGFEGFSTRNYTVSSEEEQRHVGVLVRHGMPVSIIVVAPPILRA